MSLSVICLNSQASKPVIYKAEAPEDYKDVEKRKRGSLLNALTKENSSEDSSETKQSGICVSDLFNKSESKNTQEDKNTGSDSLEVSNDKKFDSKRDKAFNAAVDVLKEFPVKKFEKDSGVLETDFAKCKTFDSTNICKYKVIVRVNNNGGTSVVVLVEEEKDSKPRLIEHAKKIEQLIKERVQN